MGGGVREVGGTLASRDGGGGVRRKVRGAAGSKMRANVGAWPGPRGAQLGPLTPGCPPCAPCARSAVSSPPLASCTQLSCARASCVLGTLSPPETAAGSEGRAGRGTAGLAGTYRGSGPEPRAQLWAAGPGCRILGDRWRGSGTARVQILGPGDQGGWAGPPGAGGLAPWRCPWR